MRFWQLVHRRKTLTEPFPELEQSVKGEMNDEHEISSLLQLPPEIIFHIFSYLSCPSLVSLSRTSKLLRFHAENDLLWANHLREQLPPEEVLESPYPADSYRSLYISHHPYWYLTRYKIWFSDHPHTGRIILVKFDPRRGCIEGYRLIADRGEQHFQAWIYQPTVIIHTFSPKVILWLSDPVLKLEPYPASSQARQGWWDGEIKMRTGSHAQNIFSTYFLSRAIPDELQDQSMALWPPRTIPRMPRVRSASQDNFQGWGHKPQRYDEISDTTFRIRKWIQFSIGGSSFGVRMGEEVSTWSTLKPELYTPTEEKPYQGIFVGDYASHGCEFLLVMQTDRAPTPPPRNAESQYYNDLIAQYDADNVFDSSVSDRMVTGGDDGIHYGAVEAVKLTGDPHIPRGEHTFIADDIGPDGFVRIANERPFTGARVVKSRGHVAGRGFRDDEYVPSQLILVSHDRLAQYWVPFGHISYYVRVDIDRLLASCWDGGVPSAMARDEAEILVNP